MIVLECIPRLEEIPMIASFQFPQLESNHPGHYLILADSYVTQGHRGMRCT